jgi:hypothetical protein
MTQHPTTQHPTTQHPTTQHPTTQHPTTERPDVIIVMTDEERAIPPYETDDVRTWRQRTLTGRRWFDENGVSFTRHYTGSRACVPSRPTIFTGQYPDLHGVTQTDGIGKVFDDSRMRWLRRGEVPTLGNWFRAAGYDTHYDGKWHISHADLDDAATGGVLATNDNDGVVDQQAVQRYLDADPLAPFGFSGWVGPEPHGAGLANSGVRRDTLIADRVVAWLEDRYARRRAGDTEALRPFLLVASFVNPHDIVLFPTWVVRSPLKSSHLDPPPVEPAPTADEDLRTKPAAQIAFREAYYSGYGPAPAIQAVYNHNGQRYRDLYYRLSAFPLHLPAVADGRNVGDAHTLTKMSASPASAVSTKSPGSRGSRRAWSARWPAGICNAGSAPQMGRRSSVCRRQPVRPDRAASGEGCRPVSRCRRWRLWRWSSSRKVGGPGSPASRVAPHSTAPGRGMA